MSTQNSNWAKSKWSLGAGAWFATALLLLSLSSGGASLGGGVAFAASSALAASASPTNCNAVLWLLHEMQAAAPTVVSPLQPGGVSQAEVASLLRQFKDEPLVTTTEIAIRDCRSKPVESQNTSLQRVLDTPEPQASLSPALDAILPLAPEARYDRTRTLRQYSLSAHEAGFLAGARTNRFIE